MAADDAQPDRTPEEERRYTDAQNARTVAFAPYDPRVPDDVKETLKNMEDSFGNASALGAAAALVRSTRTKNSNERG